MKFATKTFDEKPYCIHSGSLTPGSTFLRLDIRLVAANKLLKLQQLRGHLYLRFEEVLSVHVVRGGVTAVLFNVQADGGTRGACSREPHDNAATRGEASI